MSAVPGTSLTGLRLSGPSRPGRVQPRMRLPRREYADRTRHRQRQRDQRLAGRAGRRGHAAAAGLTPVPGNPGNQAPRRYPARPECGRHPADRRRRPAAGAGSAPGGNYRHLDAPGLSHLRAVAGERAVRAEPGIGHTAAQGCCLDALRTWHLSVCPPYLALIRTAPAPSGYWQFTAASTYRGPSRRLNCRLNCRFKLPVKLPV